MICQFYGLVYLFGQFFPIAAQSMQDTPIIGDILKMPMIENFFASFGGGSQRRAPVWWGFERYWVDSIVVFVSDVWQ